MVDAPGRGPVYYSSVTMSHHNHDHPIPRRRTPSLHLPGNQFGELTGEFDHWTLRSEHGGRDNPNHIYVWIRTRTGAFEVAVNVHSIDRGPGGDAGLQYALVDQDAPAGTWPQAGWQAQRLSYQRLGVTQADFRDVTSGELRALIVDRASTCQRISALGLTYPDGTGLHQVHLNSGNPAGSGFANLQNEDGALIFYSDGGVARWVFLKFQTQTL